MYALVARANWPDLLDTTTIVVFLAASLGMPFLGYYFMVVDIRAYLRSLRRAMVRVIHFFPDLPEWAQYETPGFLRALGLRMPCTDDDVKHAYRRLAEKLHPDRGGDKRRFLVLQRHFERAQKYVRDYQPEHRVLPNRHAADKSP